MDKKRDKQERKILDTQERAFWDVYRPPPGSINTTEMEIKKVCRINKLRPYAGSSSEGGQEPGGRDPVQVAQLTRNRLGLQARRDKRTVKVSKCAETYVEFFTLYQEHDPFLVTQDPVCPWISDNPDCWESEKSAKDLSAKRVRRWTFSGGKTLSICNFPQNTLYQSCA